MSAVDNITLLHLIADSSHPGLFIKVEFSASIVEWTVITVRI